MNPRYGRHALVLRGGTGVGKTTSRRVIEQRLNDDSSTVVLDHGWGSGEKRSVAASPADRYSDLLGRPERMLLVELGWGEEASTKPREWIDFLKADARYVLLVRLTGPYRERGTGADEHHQRVEQLDFSVLAGLPEEQIITRGLTAEEIADRILAIPCPHCP